MGVLRQQKTLTSVMHHYIQWCANHDMSSFSHTCAKLTKMIFLLVLMSLLVRKQKLTRTVLKKYPTAWKHTISRCTLHKKICDIIFLKILQIFLERVCDGIHFQLDSLENELWFKIFRKSLSKQYTWRRRNLHE